MKKSFTLLELVLVIVIITIMAAVGMNLLTFLYGNYLRSRAINQLESEIDSALNIITAKLEYRIKQTAISRSGASNGNTFARLEMINYPYPTTLEWIGKSMESKKLFSSNMTPNLGWSGLIDLNSSGTKKYPNSTNGYIGTLQSPSSNLPKAGAIINALYPGAQKTAGLIFNKPFVNIHDAFGFSGLTHKHDNIAIVDLSTSNKNKFNISSFAPIDNQISDQYYLAHTAYALVPGETVPIKDRKSSDIKGYYPLKLYYNYQPWNKQSYKDGKGVFIADYVTKFTFKEFVNNTKDTSGAIVINLCVIDGGRSLHGKEANTEICKTKAIY